MIRKIILAAVIAVAFPAHGNELTLPIRYVYDGDTIKSFMYVLPEELNEVSVRIRGIDTPELPAASYRKTGKLGRSSCDKEAELAILATKALVDMTKDTDFMVLRQIEWGKFGGRIVARVDIDGYDVATRLMSLGLAVAYDGGKKTHDWCK